MSHCGGMLVVEETPQYSSSCDSPLLPYRHLNSLTFHCAHHMDPILTVVHFDNVSKYKAAV